MQTPTTNTLFPCREESLDFDQTNNLFIESENLEALKILQKSYAGCVKMIYIDPSYNTGNDSFIYPDKFSETREEYARRVGDKDTNGYLKKEGVFQGAFRKNAKDNGHFHSNWLNMMLPRLHLAKTLLSDDGVIFISIDDNEQAQLKLLCDEVFGEENFVGEIIRKTKSMTADNSNGFNIQHEILVVYAKKSENLILAGEEKTFSNYSNSDNDPNGEWCAGDPSAKSGGKSTNFGIETPYTHRIDYPPKGRYWAFSQSTLEEYIKSGKIKFKKEYRENERGFIFKRYKNAMSINTEPVNSLFGIENEYMNQTATVELRNLFGLDYFLYPKPVTFIKKLIKYTNPNLILDFFSGSGTTAHAVMQLNAEDGGNRRYICVQIPEICEENSEAAKAGFATIADIAKERIRRAGAKIKQDNPGKNIDTGFKVFKLAESHFKQWQGKLKNIRHSDLERSKEEKSQFFSGKASSPTAQNDGVVTQADLLSALENHTDTLVSDNTENIFYELLLRFSLRPTAEIVQDNGVYCVKDKGACFVFVIQAQNADEAFFENILQKYQPLKVVVLEKIFNGKDDLKKNTALQIKDNKAMFVCV